MERERERLKGIIIITFTLPLLSSLETGPVKEIISVKGRKSTVRSAEITISSGINEGS